MKQVVWMAAGCIGSWLVAAVVIGYSRELFLGMLAPLVASAATWMAVDRVRRQGPARVNAVLIGAFGAKIVFFGAYILAVTRLWPLAVVPFMASFAVYFIGLQVVNAALVRGAVVSRAS